MNHRPLASFGRQTDGRTHKQTDLETDRLIDGQAQTDRHIYSQRDGLTRHTDGRIDGRADGQTHRQIRTSKSTVSEQKAFRPHPQSIDPVWRVV